MAADVTFGDLLADRTAHVPQVRPYRPGQFYLRELPPLHAVLAGPAHMRLLDSTRPLYVTAAGMPRHDAADVVRHMAGHTSLAAAVPSLVVLHGVNPESHPDLPRTARNLEDGVEYG